MELFEFIFLFVINSQKNSILSKYQGIDLYNCFISSMELELKKQELSQENNEHKIRNEFKKYNFDVLIKGKKIVLIKNGISKNIEDYTKYNMTESFFSFISKHFTEFKDSDFYDGDFYNFNYLKESKNYFNGLLDNIIEKYVSSNLAKNSYSKMF